MELQPLTLSEENQIKTPSNMSFDEFISYIHPETYKIWEAIIEDNNGFLIKTNILQGLIKPSQWDSFLLSGIQKAIWESQISPFMRKSVRIFDSPMYYRILISAQDKNKSMKADITYIPEQSQIYPYVRQLLSNLRYYEEVGTGINFEHVYPEIEYSTFV